MKSKYLAAGRAAFVALTLVILVAIPSWAADTWTYTKTDNAEAAKSLSAFVKDHDMKVGEVSGSSFRLNLPTSDLTVIIAPKMGALDRLTVISFFLVKDEWKKKAEVLEMVNAINTKWNVGTLYIDEDGDLGFNTQATMYDSISWQELNAFFNWLDFSLLTVVAENKDKMTKYLK